MACNRCNKCKSANYVEIGSMNFFNIECGILKKNVDYSVTKVAEVTAPNWCPQAHAETDKKETPNYTPSLYERRKAWEEIKPKVKWSEIKKGETYHVPPHIGNSHRFDIDIVYVDPNGSYFTYRKSNSDSYMTEYVYPTDVLFKVMVKNKLEI